MKTCPQCTELFEAKPNQVYCSQSCKKRTERIKNAERIKAYNKRAGGKYRGRVMSKQCPECKQYGVRPDSVYCSIQCSKNSRFSKCKEITIWIQPTPKAKATKAPTIVSFVNGKCLDCATNYTYQRTGKRKLSRYCSTICERRAARRNSNHIRRHRITSSRKGDVYRAKIFEKDSYVCQLCNEPVDTTAHWNDDRYPSLDHIIPLAHGGSHSMDNLQTAHRICNALKSDQLILAA